ncbi:MAG TPA: 50S ribosomal protein L1 [bacterium]|nr:50S ribosomal protein L1 [bacterium]
MTKLGKRTTRLRSMIDGSKGYQVEEAMGLIEQMKGAKFDETVDVAIRLGVDPRKSDQMVRGTVSLPHGTGKTVRVLVFAKGEKEKEAQDAGADFVGSDDLIKKIQEGWTDFDKAIATPDMMGVVSRLGKILGPRGLMPNPKVGTVTMDIARAVKELKGGRVEFRVDKGSNVHCPIGKHSFGKQKLTENFTALFEAVMKAKPDTAKGTFVKNITVSTTMGPGIRIEAGALREESK